MDVEFGPYRLRRRERCLEGPAGRLDISGRSFDLLDTLLRHPNEPVSKAQLFDAVWHGLAVEENTLQAHISNLRKLLGASIIVTVHGRSYSHRNWDFLKGAVAEPFVDAEPRQRLILGLKKALEA